MEGLSSFDFLHMLNEVHMVCSKSSYALCIKGRPKDYNDFVFYRTVSCTACQKTTKQKTHKLGQISIRAYWVACSTKRQTKNAWFLSLYSGSNSHTVQLSVQLHLWKVQLQQCVARSKTQLAVMFYWQADKFVLEQKMRAKVLTKLDQT